MHTYHGWKRDVLERERELSEKAVTIALSYRAVVYALCYALGGGKTSIYGILMKFLEFSRTEHIVFMCRSEKEN